jgi:hypothetical protein
MKCMAQPCKVVGGCGVSRAGFVEGYGFSRTVRVPNETGL